MTSNNHSKLLYDPSSPDFDNLFLSPAGYTDRLPSPKPIYLRSLDQDDPGPSEHHPKESLHYDDQITPTDPFNDALSVSTQAATARVAKAKAIFGTITNVLDNHCDLSGSHLTATQARFLGILRDERLLVTKNTSKHIYAARPWD